MGRAAAAIVSLEHSAQRTSHTSHSQIEKPNMTKTNSKQHRPCNHVVVNRLYRLGGNNANVAPIHRADRAFKYFEGSAQKQVFKFVPKVDGTHEASFG